MDQEGEEIIEEIHIEGGQGVEDSNNYNQVIEEDFK
jgi:hypothetical protein